MKDETLNHSVDEVREYHSDSCGIFFRVERSVYRGRSQFQSIEIFDNPFFGRVLMLDGLVQTTIRDEHYYHEMLVHPAMMTHPDPKRILIIGGGDGGVLREVLRHPIEKAVLVEIDDQVLDVSEKYFPWLAAAKKDPRAEIIVDDGNVYIENASCSFDVVLIDSSDPVGPSSVLHARDFYIRLKKILSPEGIIAAQVGSPFFHAAVLADKKEFLAEIFPGVRFYVGPVPTYPGGTWCYAFMSVKPDFPEPRNEPLEGLKYYNPPVHQGAFALSEALKIRLDADQPD